MNRHLLQACEGVDASVFSGDVLYNDEDRAELKKYVARWQRAIDEHEAPEKAEAQAKSEPAALTEEQLEAAVSAWFTYTADNSSDFTGRMRAAIAATQEQKP